MAIEPVEQKGSSIFSWATKKGKQLFEKALGIKDIEPEPMAAPKKNVILTPKSSGPVKWPLPAKK